MKEQYVGDINDYRKYALLRALSCNGSARIGVCWMLTPSDGSSDGNKLAYLSQPHRYRAFDPELFDILSHAAAEPSRRRLKAIEESGAIRGAIYHNEALPEDLAKRGSFMSRCASKFRDVGLVFFDPDNGIETKLAKGRKNSSKYVYLDELIAFYGAGKSMLVYQHFPRIERETFILSCADRLRRACPSCTVWAFSTSHVVFFLVLHPAGPSYLAAAATEACSRWDSKFISGRCLEE